MILLHSSATIMVQLTNIQFNEYYNLYIYINTITVSDFIYLSYIKSIKRYINTSAAASYSFIRTTHNTNKWKVNNNAYYL